MPRYERVFVDVDTQFDFMDPAGQLYVPGAKEMYGALRRLFAFAAQARIPVLSSTDDHPPGDPEFVRFGPHCVRDTDGQKKLPLTILPRARVVPPEQPPDKVETLLNEYDQLIFPKATLDAFDNPSFAALIDRMEVGAYIVFGVATDYCVLLAAMGLLERGRKVKLVRDAVKAITLAGGEQSRRSLAALGAELCSVADVVGGLA